MKITAFFVLVFAAMLGIAGVGGWALIPPPFSYWTSGAVSLFFLISSYFLVKKRLHWAWADLVLLFFLVLFFVYQGLSDNELYPFFVMSAVALLVMLLLIVSLWRELKKRE